MFSHYAYIPSLLSTDGAAVITGSGGRRGGGPAARTRWCATRASASTQGDDAGRVAGGSPEERPPLGHYEPGAVRLLGALLKGAPDERGRSGAAALSRTRTVWDAGRSGILKIVSWSPASCSLLFEPRTSSPRRKRPGGFGALAHQA